MAEVKPVPFSPVNIDPAFGKAISGRWALLLGQRPFRDFIGVMAKDDDGQTKTIAIALDDDGLRAASLSEDVGGGHAEALFCHAARSLGNVGVHVARNKVIKAYTQKSLFHFGDRK